MGANPVGPDYGVFEFEDLFSEAILGHPFRELTPRQRADLVQRFEYKVSDHLPLWIRLPLPIRLSPTSHRKVRNSVCPGSLFRPSGSL